MIKLLVSVKNVDEALLAARGGAHFIDLKDPAAGALGGLPVATIRAILAALRSAGFTLPVSATIGDVPVHRADLIRERVDAVGACSVDYVKVGIERDPAAAAALESLARLPWPIVPVLIADHGLDDALVDRALGLGFPGLMLDTADKRAGSLFDVLPPAMLQGFVERVRAHGTLVGLAGALRLVHLVDLAALQPDFAGFRSAVCATERSGALDAERLRDLVGAMRHAQRTAATAPSGSAATLARP
jgi:(5-formylfuran-3-yl)methyl phosphate synthase